jgi:hypothetical protein
MKKISTLALALLLPTALLLTAAAQEQEAQKEAAAAPAKPAAKKKAKKKKKAEPVSEYKFGAVDKPSTYKFDRESEPITKESAKKAAAEKAAAKKKKKKGAAKKAVSEYKFEAVESVPTYKMDKYADPIVKTPKKKKAGAKKKPAAPAEPAPGHDASGAIPEVN